MVHVHGSGFNTLIKHIKFCQAQKQLHYGIFEFNVVKRIAILIFFASTYTGENKIMDKKFASENKWRD